jgi:radical SAM protein with 4Fe4S-binding SPASM domain
MDEYLLNKLRIFNFEGSYEKIIKCIMPVVADNPKDYKALYCIGMAYIAEGDRIKGLKYLQQLISIWNNIVVDKNSMLFINRVKAQVVEISEIYLHSGDTLGDETINTIRDINKLARKNSDKELFASTEGILKRWYHKLPSKRPIIAQISELPLILQVEPTNLCNLKCTMCPRSSMTRELGYMDIHMFSEMLYSWENRCAVIPIKHLIFGTNILLTHRGSLKLFFMGEPMLHPQLNKLIEIGNSAGCKVGLQTNGSMLDKEDIRKKMLSAAPAVIGVSLDGIDPTSYESVRPGSRWEQVCRGLELLSRERDELGLNKKTLITVSSIIPKWNQESLKRSEKFLDPIREFVDSVGFIPLSCERDPEFFNENGDIVAYNKHSEISYNTAGSLCTEPFTKLNVLWDGTVTACCYDIDGKMPLGHISSGIDNIWRSSKMTELHNSLLNKDTSLHPLCTTCKSNC